MHINFEGNEAWKGLQIAARRAGQKFKKRNHIPAKHLGILLLLPFDLCHPIYFQAIPSPFILFHPIYIQAIPTPFYFMSSYLISCTFPLPFYFIASVRTHTHT